ncbi:MAG TPA: hypothetical protein VNT99_20270 [Methylomirabilota bacterium]|nr:hypothetical protein [Methylomirabilota bacterium]
MLADISGLIGLVIFIAIAIIASLLKRKEDGDFELPPELKPRRDKPPRQPSAQPRNWEQQLRELLEERSAPPPIVEEVQPPEIAWEGPTPPVFIPSAHTRPTERPSHHVHTESHIDVASRTPHPQIQPSFQHLPGLTDPGAGYADASHLQERVAHHLAEATRHRVGITSVLRHETSHEIRDAIGLVRDHKTIRAAMIASVILGPPRALET